MLSEVLNYKLVLVYSIPFPSSVLFHAIVSCLCLFYKCVIVINASEKLQTIEFMVDKCLCVRALSILFIFLFLLSLLLPLVVEDLERLSMKLNSTASLMNCLELWNSDLWERCKFTVWLSIWRWNVLVLILASLPMSMVMNHFTTCMYRFVLWSGGVWKVNAFTWCWHSHEFSAHLLVAVLEIRRC